MFNKKRSIKFRGRKHSRKGIISFILGLVILIAFFILSISSSNVRGNGGIELGIIAIACFFISILGFIVGIYAAKEKDIFLTVPILGIVINGFMFLVYMSLYIIGVIS